MLCFSAPVGAKRRGGPGGLNKVCGVSPELQAIVGEPALPRTEVVISKSTTILFVGLFYYVHFWSINVHEVLILIKVLTKLRFAWYRLWSSCGHTSGKTISKIQVTRGRLSVMMPCVWSLRLTVLTCSRWISC